MDCHEIQEKLGAYLDGELPPDQAKLVSEHLESCATCQAEWERWCKLNDLVEETEGLDPGTEAWKRMRSKIQAGISHQKQSERAGVVEWIRWLLSPRYVVVKVGAALAVVVIAFVVTRQVSVKQMTPAGKTIPESAIPGTLGPGTTQGISVPGPNAISESLQVKSFPRKGIGRLVEEVGKIEVKPTSPHLTAQPESRAEMDSLPQLQTQAEQAPLSLSRETNVREVLQTLPGVHVDSEGEFHFRGGRSHEVLPMQDKSSKNVIVEGLTASETRVPGEGPTSAGAPPGQPKQEQIPVSAPVHAVQSSVGISLEDSLLSLPFSPISYWETYRVSLDTSAVLPTALDSLRYEYRRCEKLPCLKLVLPYLADMLFRQVLLNRKADDIAETAEFMKQYRGVLKQTWGGERYTVRWEKIREIGGH